MTIGQSLLPEFDNEMANTRKVLELLPDEKWNWKPHEKSGTLGWYALHIATLPSWTTMTLTSEQFDYAPVGEKGYEPPKVENRAQALAVFDKETKEARAELEKISDADIVKNWKLLAGGQECITMPRVAVLRGLVMNHLIHHRGQLTVYYRLLGVPVPGLYGPSADEGESAASA
ncbi:MAG TPA: DinB family protein [Candidatus Acidoferrales bacterium]